MNVLLVGTGGFINGTDPKIPAAGRPYMAMRRGAQNTIFGAPPVWPPPPQPRLGGPARGRPAIYGSGRRPSVVVVALLLLLLPNPSKHTHSPSVPSCGG
ncbi:hypothetical protein ACI65C_003351 [Semiaphis heraclei]